MSSQKPRMKNKTKKALYGYLFSLPWSIGFALFGLYPLIRSIRFALSSKESLNAATRVFKFSGFGFFQITKLITENPDHLKIIGQFALDILEVVPIVLVFALILALLLNQPIKGRGVFRSIFFLPVVLLSGAMLGYFSSYNLLTVPSITNGALENAINNFFPGFLSTFITEIFGRIVLILWLSGVQILIFMAGLSKIDKQVYEAAKVDGASGWDCFWKITFPALIPLMFINIIYTTVIYSNLGNFNPLISLIQSTQTNLVQYGRGYASMLSWILFLIDILIIGVYSLIIKLASKRYE